MQAEQLRAMQAPLKAKYKSDPATARASLTATGRLDNEAIVCHVESFSGSVPAGLHPATGGDGQSACSADMLLEALVGCAGVTLRAVAAAMKIPLRDGLITATGELDFRGTLGVDRQVPVGFQSIHLSVKLDTNADDEQIQTLLKLTERYCVVFQTLAAPPKLTVSCQNLFADHDNTA